MLGRNARGIAYLTALCVRCVETTERVPWRVVIWVLYLTAAAFIAFIAMAVNNSAQRGAITNTDMTSRCVVLGDAGSLRYASIVDVDQPSSSLQLTRPIRTPQQ